MTGIAFICLSTEGYELRVTLKRKMKQAKSRLYALVDAFWRHSDLRPLPGSFDEQEAEASAAIIAKVPDVPSDVLDWIKYQQRLVARGEYRAHASLVCPPRLNVSEMRREQKLERPSSAPGGKMNVIVVQTNEERSNLSKPTPNKKKRPPMAETSNLTPGKKKQSRVPTQPRISFSSPDQIL